MRSGTNCTIISGEVYAWSQKRLLQAKLVKDHGWRCMAAVVLGITLRAAARCISVSAACRDLAKAPSDQAVMTALKDGLPKTLSVLERRVNEALATPLPRSLRRRAWRAAGWYSHTMTSGKKAVTFSVCVNYRRYRNRKDGKAGSTPARAIPTCDCFSSPWGSSSATCGCGFIRRVLPKDRVEAWNPHLELLRFKRMLDWIVYEVVNLLHDGSIPYITRPS